MADNINQRKIEHISIVTEKDVEPVKEIWDKYKIPYSALPEMDLDKADCSCEFLGYKLGMPVMLGSMTGGPSLAGDINKNLAISAQKAKIPVALGSMRVILKNPETLSSFQVKKYCPDVPLIGNIGLVQLNFGIGINEIKQIIDDTQIDALFFHVNHMQEAVQPEGDTNFSGLLDKLKRIIPQINIPVLLKEVGAGIDAETAKKLFECGVKYLDVSGLGGTSWTVVEAFRRQDNVGFTFQEVGIATDEALIECSKIKGLELIAGGGIRNGLDVVKSLMLGAKIASVAKPLLKPAINSSLDCTEYLDNLKREIKIAMFAMGAKNLEEVRLKKLTVVSCNLQPFS
jgi:isopentenyl-diphosphate delta-isomerase